MLASSSPNDDGNNGTNNRKLSYSAFTTRLVSRKETTKRKPTKRKVVSLKGLDIFVLVSRTIINEKRFDQKIQPTASVHHPRVWSGRRAGKSCVPGL